MAAVPVASSLIGEKVGCAAWSDEAEAEIKAAGRQHVCDGADVGYSLVRGSPLPYLLRTLPASPRWQAIVGRDWWGLDGHGAQ